MDERDFELLTALDQTKNITHAANRLYVTQSSLSKRINAIEQELGVTLLLRSRQGIRFTPEGEIVLHYAKEAAAQLDHMRAALDTRRPYICGTLNAGVSINYALYRFPDILAMYRKKYPHVNTHIVTDHSRNLYLQALDGVLDVAIIRGEYPWKGNKLLLDRENIYAISSMEHKGLSLGEIPYIGHKTDSVFERELTRWLHENNIQVDQTNGILVDSIGTCVEMVNRGLGWAIVPEICLANFHGNRTPLFFANGEPFIRSTWLMYSDDAMALRQVEAFVTIFRELKNETDRNKEQIL